MHAGVNKSAHLVCTKVCDLHVYVLNSMVRTQHDCAQIARTQSLCTHVHKYTHKQHSPVDASMRKHKMHRKWHVHVHKSTHKHRAPKDTRICANAKTHTKHASTCTHGRSQTTCTDGHKCTRAHNHAHTRTHKRVQLAHTTTLPHYRMRLAHL